MAKHADQPMNLAEAPSIVATEPCALTRVFTIARDDFQTYRGRRPARMEIL
jgi:hypothetical protein